MFQKLFVAAVFAWVSLAAGLVTVQAADTAGVAVKDAWVRSTVPGQMGTGAFMKITSQVGTQLVGVTSPVAGVGEVHEMKMDGEVMKMRAMTVLVLPAGKTIELKPGGYHVMLMDLKQPLLKDTQIPLTLTFKDGKGAQTKLDLMVPVTNISPARAAAKAAEHKH